MKNNNKSQTPKAPITAPESIVAYDESHFGNAVVPPIFQNSLFTFDDFDDMVETYSGRKVRPVYRILR